jgi:MFS family permease
VRDQLADALNALRDPLLRASILGGFLVFIAIFGLFLTVLPVHLAEVFGLGAGARGVIISIPAITASLASFNLGRIRTATSARSVVILSAVALVLSYMTLGLTTTLWVAVLAALIYGTSEGFFIPMLQDTTMEAAPPEHRAAVIAVWVGFARLGQTIGPLLAGVSVGLAGNGPTFVYGSGIAVLILALGIFGPFPRNRQKSVSVA